MAWSRRSFISTSATAAAGLLAGCREESPFGPEAGPPTRAPNPVTILPVDDERPLHERAVAKGLYFGSSTELKHLQNDPAFKEALVGQCGITVPEGVLKFGPLRPTREEFRFAPADAMLDFADAHNMRFRGHTLVWHSPGSTPDWFLESANASNAEEILIEHIHTTVDHYRGRIHSWDVVNEGIYAGSSRADKLRETFWLELIGPEYIEIAFSVAAAADEHARLVYNDYAVDYAIPAHDVRRSAILRLLERLLARNTPIHALGIQAHLQAGLYPFDQRVLRDFLAEVGQLGLGIIITELDVTDYYISGDVSTRDEAVADHYREYLDVVLDEPAVEGVVLWGLADHYHWLRRWGPPRPDGAVVRPAPFSDQLERKPAWTAIAECLANTVERRRPEAPVPQNTVPGGLR